jgi:hypothetical protein
MTAQISLTMMESLGVFSIGTTVGPGPWPASLRIFEQGVGVIQRADVVQIRFQYPFGDLRPVVNAGVLWRHGRLLLGRTLNSRFERAGARETVGGIAFFTKLELRAFGEPGFPGGMKVGYFIPVCLRLEAFVVLTQLFQEVPRVVPDGADIFLVALLG